MPSFGDGGVERMLVNLAGGLVAAGMRVDFLTRPSDLVYRERLDRRVRLIETGATDLFRALPTAIRYLRQERPDIVLCGKDRAASAVLLARRLSGVEFSLVMRHGTTVSARLAGRSRWKRWRATRTLQRIHAGAAAIVANSQGVAADMARFAGVPLDHIHLILNPVVTAELAAMANEPLAHPWFAQGQIPVLVGIGGLRRQKGFDTLLAAFAGVRRQRDCRLVILGEGRLRGALQEQASALGIAEHVDLPGFDSNPYRYLARAALFVLASRWEGSPNVLTEALALGTPVVATNCPSGPAEILDGGRVAPLVPVDDVAAMTSAMLEVLACPGDADSRIAATRPYTVARCAASYQRLFMSLRQQAAR